jgi:hypothetical protein
MTVVARQLPVVGAVNAGKSQMLSVMGAELDRVRAGVWARFAGAKSAQWSKRQIRDRLLAEDAPAGVGVPQRLWRATVEDTVDKIRAWQQSVIATQVHPKIYARAGDNKEERRRLLALANAGRWRDDPWLSRQCRDAFASKRPRPRRSGRIVADNCSYDTARDEHGRVWLAVMTPTRGQRLRLNLGPLPEELVPTSTIQIGPDGRGGWQVIAAYPAIRVSSTRPRHERLVAVEGIDAGVTEVFTTTGGRRYGAGQYQRIAACGHLGIRRGKNVPCQTAGCPQQGIVYDTEFNAARNILARATDPEISRYTPKHVVKRILIERVGTMENCPTTTQATTTKVAAVSETTYLPSKPTPKK